MFSMINKCKQFEWINKQKPDPTHMELKGNFNEN